MSHWIHEWGEPSPGAELVNVDAGEVLAVQKDTDITIPVFVPFVPSLPIGEGDRLAKEARELLESLG